MIDLFGYFIQENSANNRLEQMSLPTMQSLLQLYLNNNYVRYRNQLYTFTKGSPATIPLSEILATIYVHEWQRHILSELERHRELFGRHKNELFFTWNGSSDEMEGILKKLQRSNPNVQFQYTLSSMVSFFGARIENQKGHLYTCVDPRSFIIKYTLPYVSQHAKQQHSDGLRASLNRALCYCSSVEDFQCERLYLELTYLANGYSLLFIESHLHYFFDYFHGHAVRYQTDQSNYHSFRGHWLDMMKREDDLISRFQRLNHERQVIRFQYLFEYGPRSRFNQRFHQIWSRFFDKHPRLSSDKTMILLTSKHQHSLNALLSCYQ